MANTSKNKDERPYEAFETAYQDYLTSLDEIGRALNAQMVDAHGEAAKAQSAMSASPEEMQAAFETMSENYIGQVHATWEESQDGYAKAYFAFLQSFGKAWAAADKEIMHPGAVATLAQCIESAAGIAASTIGNLDIFAQTGVMPPAAEANAPVESGKRAK